MIKVIFMGTPDFSVPTLKKLYEDKYIDVKLVVTKKDAIAFRGNKICISDVKREALDLGIEVLTPEKIKEDRDCMEKMKSLKPDFIIVVAYGQILSKEILDIPKYGCINGHASILPKYRGASPIQSAILYGDRITGTTSMLMDVGLDTGDILSQKEVEIDKKETAESLFEKLSVVTADNIIYTIKNFDNIEKIKQDESKATKSVIIKKEFGEIKFENESAVEIDRKIRAYTPWPSAYTYIDGIQHKIHDVDVVDDEVRIDFLDDIYATSNAIRKTNKNDISKSFIKKIDDNIFIINDEMIAKCKDGYLKINEIQRSGKNKLKARDYINGLKSKED